MQKLELTNTYKRRKKSQINRRTTRLAVHILLFQIAVNIQTHQKWLLNILMIFEFFKSGLYFEFSHPLGFSDVT